MDLQNKSALEAYIDSHAGSKLRPILADVNLQQDLTDEAVTVCQKIVAEDPDSPYGYYLLALAEIKSGETANAVEYLKKTIDLDYGFLDAYYLLVETGKEKLSPGELKACYEKIVELNPFDDDIRTEVARISEDADRQSLKNIQLPEIKLHTVASRAVAEEKPAEPEPEPAAEPQLTEEPTPKVVDETPEPVSLSEEEAHLGPIIPDEEVEPQAEPVPEIAIQPEEQPVASREISPETTPEPQPEQVQETATPNAPAVPKESIATPPTSTGSPSSALNDMFAKLKSKPLEEVQKENWTLPVVEAPEAEPNPDELIKKPNIKFTVPLKDEADSKKKLEEIQKEIGMKPQSGAPEPDEKKNESADQVLKTPKTPKKKSGKASPKKSAAGKKAEELKVNADGKVELKIPVPTFTLVEVFKKQKLYDEALQLLDVLTKKSKNQARIEKEREEILRLKMEEE